MQDISFAELERVTGGTLPLSGTPSGSPGCAGTNSQVFNLVQNLDNQLNSLTKNQNNGLFGSNDNMMMFMFALAMERRQQVTVVGNGGYYYRY
jgi:hypothetical protein